jgi:hypothetical protein
LQEREEKTPMSDQPAIPITDAVETFVASLRQRAVPLNTIKSYAHDLRLFVQAVPADLAIVTWATLTRSHWRKQSSAPASAKRRDSPLVVVFFTVMQRAV